MGNWYAELDAGIRAVFATLSTKEKAQAKHHCGAPGDPPDSFPVPDAEHARNALARAHFSKDPAHVRACVARVVKEEGWDVQVNAGAPSEAPPPVVFSATADALPLDAGETEVLRALVFRCGDYPEQHFSLTEDEADALIAEFAPVAARHGHPRSKGPLDGRLGTMTRLWRQGRDLFGLFDVPKWLTALIPPEHRKLSLGFDHWPTKRITEWSWVTEPIISDTQLEAAFAAFAGSRHSQADQAMLDSACTLLVHAGANPPGTYPAGGMARYAKEPQRMTWKDKILEALRGVPDDFEPPVTVDNGASPPARVLGSDPTAQFAQREAALAEQERALQQQRAEFARQQYRTKAETDVERLIREGRVLPAENPPGPDGVPSLVAFGAQLLADDASTTAIFGQSGGSRYAAWLASFAARPAQAVDTERVPVTVFGTDTPQGGDPAVDASIEAARHYAQQTNGLQAVK